MCLAVCYTKGADTIITHFTEPLAKLPVKTKTAGIAFVQWGRRIQEKSNLPLGGWVSLPMLKEGKWDYYLPKSVKIPAKKFMEQDIESKLRWFDVTPGQSIQGVFLQEKEEQRIYVVTLLPEKPESIYMRWPRLIID